MLVAGQSKLDWVLVAGAGRRVFGTVDMGGPAPLFYDPDQRSAHGMHCLGTAQFYLPPACEPFMFLPFQPKPVLIYRPRKDWWLS